MKTAQKDINYVKWLSAEEMHENSRHWLSELHFIKDEQLFFDNLIKSYTLQLTDSSHFKKSKKVVDKLFELQNETNGLIKIINKHENNLKIMVDTIDQIKEESYYKDKHRELITSVNDFFQSYQIFKKILFRLIKNIIREQKQKLLIK
jgi:hypothetical protein